MKVTITIVEHMPTGNDIRATKTFDAESIDDALMKALKDRSMALGSIAAILPKPTIELVSKEE